MKFELPSVFRIFWMDPKASFFSATLLPLFTSKGQLCHSNSFTHLEPHDQSGKTLRSKHPNLLWKSTGEKWRKRTWKEKFDDIQQTNCMQHSKWSHFVIMHTQTHFILWPKDLSTAKGRQNCFFFFFLTYKPWFFQSTKAHTIKSGSKHEKIWNLDGRWEWEMLWSEWILDQ